MRLLALGMVLLAALLAVLTPRPHPPGTIGAVLPPRAADAVETAKSAPIEPPTPAFAPPPALAIPALEGSVPADLLDGLDLANPPPPFAGMAGADIYAAVAEGRAAPACTKPDCGPETAGGPGAALLFRGQALSGGPARDRAAGPAANGSEAAPSGSDDDRRPGGNVAVAPDRDPGESPPDGPVASPGAGGLASSPGVEDPPAAGGAGTGNPGSSAPVAPDGGPGAPSRPDQSGGSGGSPEEFLRLVEAPAAAPGNSVPVPEPNNLALAATGLLFLAMRRRR